MLNHILSLTPEALSTELCALFPAYRAKQVLEWIFTKFTTDPDEMTNLPSDIKEHLKLTYRLDLPVIDARLVSRDETVKYRLQLHDGKFIEMVMIPESKKRTLCISSQVGCGRGCEFCATGVGGLRRNLEPDEIIGQFILAAKDLLPHRITNLVFMGMGEPMDNLDNVLFALKTMQHEKGLAFSPRRTTISTCGVAPAIRRLADSGIKTKLAVSLNSADSETRMKIMPVEKQYHLNELKQALLYFRRKTNFRITFEYILIPGVNMSYEDIRHLSRFVNDISCKINFIPFNPINSKDWQPPTKVQIDDFLQKAAIIKQAVTLRKSRGADIMGACGQLAAKANQTERLI